jgi:hypothetical protein
VANITVTNSAAKIVAANTARLSLLIQNSGGVTVYIGPSSSVSISNGVPIDPGGVLQEDSGGARMYQGDIYGVCATSSDVRYWERTR